VYQKTFVDPVFDSTPVSTTIGLRIKSLRLELGLDRAGFGRFVGATETQVRSWERDSPNNERNADLLQLLTDVAKPETPYLLTSFDRPKCPSRSIAARALLKLRQENWVFRTRLRDQLGEWPRSWRSLHILVSSPNGRRYVNLTTNGSRNPGVNVQLDEECDRVLKVDVTGPVFRDLNVEWAFVLAPYARIWDSITLKLSIDRRKSRNGELSC